MLSLSKKTDYALLALSYLTRAEAGRAVNTKEIAEQYAIPVELLAKILQKLARARFITSTPGPTGGYKLARPAAEISVGSVVELIDGPPAIATCMKTVGNRCDQLNRCTIRHPLARINARILQMLNLISLQEINDDSGENDIMFEPFGRSANDRPRRSETLTADR
jgi:Rrf2 family protein